MGLPQIEHLCVTGTQKKARPASQKPPFWGTLWAQPPAKGNALQPELQASRLRVLFFSTFVESHSRATQSTDSAVDIQRPLVYLQVYITTPKRNSIPFICHLPPRPPAPGSP